MESHAIKEARTAEAQIMSPLGLLEVWRHIYDDVDDEVAVGATRGRRQNDRVLIPSSYGTLLDGAFKMGIGKSQCGWCQSAA